MSGKSRKFSSKKLLYRIVPHNDGVVFAEPARAKFVASLHRAIRKSRTWGQFRKAVPAAEYSRIVRSSFDDQGEPRPRSSDRFDGEQIAGWSDGDYPPWLQSEMDLLLPRDVLEDHGDIEDTAVNGSFWLIPSENLKAICADLKALGWELERAQGLEFH
jgi:hypothetical protein